MNVAPTEIVNDQLHFCLLMGLRKRMKKTNTLIRYPVTSRKTVKRMSMRKIEQTVRKPLRSGQDVFSCGVRLMVQDLLMSKSDIPPRTIPRSMGRNPGPGLSSEPRGYRLDSTRINTANNRKKMLAIRARVITSVSLG
jgi:hypothetical protein